MTKTNARIAGILERLRHTAAVRCALPMADYDLLQRYVSYRDEVAFAELVRRHGPMVMGLCWRLLRHRQDAEDAFQAAFLVLARKAGSIRKRASLASWLHCVAVRAATRLRTANGRRHARQAPLGDVVPMACPEDLTLWETQHVLDEELGRLPNRYRAPLLLCCVQGRTRDEAAQQLGWSLGVLRGRLERGRELLRARLARRGVALAVALLPLSAVGAGQAPMLPALLASTVRAALGPAHASAAAVSARAAALAQGVIQAMFLAKVKVVAVGLLVLAFLGTGAGVVTFRAQAQDSRLSPVAQRIREDAQPPRREPTVAELQREIDRLRLELEQARHLLQLANKEILDLRAARAKAAKGGPEGGDLDPTALPERVRKAIPEERLNWIRKLPGDQLAAFSPDRKLLAAAHEKAFSIFDVETGKEMRRFIGHADAVSALAFAPDGKRLASGSKDRSAILWDLPTGKQLLRISRQTPVEAVAFTPDGRRLVVREKGQTTEINVDTGKVIRVETRPPVQ
jgi:RNA polymerase sigma factor (sigma-70 family)